MADYDLALGIKPPQIDVATPLLTAAKIRAAEQASQLHNVQTQQAQMELRRDQLGELVRSLDPYVGKPEFGDKWRAMHDEGARRGIIPPQAMSMRDSPSVLAYQSLRAATTTPDQQLRERELKLKEKVAEDKPSYHVLEDASGNKRLVRAGGLGGDVEDVTPAEMRAVPNSDATAAPPGVDPKEWRKDLAKRAAQNEEDTVKSAKAAAEFKPFIDQAVAAYEKAAKSEAIGPVVANPIARRINQYTFKTAAEKARQDYDQALQNVQLRITAAQNKGEGAVSNFERQMYTKQFPDLEALEPKDKIRYLKQIQELTHQTLASGKKSPLNMGSVPGQLERSSVFPGNDRPEISEARIAIGKGAPRDKVEQRLREKGIKFKPSDLDL